MKLSRLRVGFQVFLHVVLIGHVLAYYRLDWRDVGALDFQSFFHHFLGEGVVTAGALLAIAVYGTALVFGRLFCSWGCHFGATQDLAAWILRRFGWRPPLVRTRFLHWLPFFFLGVVFGLPLARRWLRDEWTLSVDIAAVAPWDTLPGWFLSIATFVGCGGVILLFLGTRGFCRFVCPYGALLRVTDRAAPFRVRRVAPCAGSGARSCAGGSTGDAGIAAVPPCTAACPTAIDVHRETGTSGVVTSTDCVRCNLCIEACPQGALAYRARAAGSLREAPAGDPVAAIPSSAGSLSAGSLSAGPSTAGSPPAGPPVRGAAASTLGVGAEALVAAITIGTYLIIDLVYGGHFLAAVLALGEGFLAYGALAVLRRRARGGRWTFAGVTLVGVLLLSLVPLFEAGAFKLLRYKALQIDPRRADAALDPAAPRGEPIDARDSAMLLEAAGLYARALEYFPRHSETLRLLLSVYLRLHDPRAVEVAETLWELDDNSPRSRELLYWVYLRFGQVERAELLGAPPGR